jgi:hypothetical protein
MQTDPNWTNFLWNEETGKVREFEFLLSMQMNSANKMVTTDRAHRLWRYARLLRSVRGRL